MAKLNVEMVSQKKLLRVLRKVYTFLINATSYMIRILWNISEVYYDLEDPRKYSIFHEKAKTLAFIGQCRFWESFIIEMNYHQNTWPELMRGSITAQEVKGEMNRVLQMRLQIFGSEDRRVRIVELIISRLDEMIEEDERF